MTNRILFILIPIMIFSCDDPPPGTISGKEQFASELQQLQEYFHIPGIAVIAKKGDQTIYEDYLGFADLDQKIPLDSATTIPMASLTKIFSGLLVWQLVEEGKVSLEDPIARYLEDAKVPDSIRIAHLLSHTSQGDVGKNFYYNNSRFMLLGAAIEKAGGQSFKSSVYGKIIDPLELTNTYLLEDSAQVANENRKIAQPYFWGGEMKGNYQEQVVTDGFIDYGYSPAAGIASTVRDLAKLSRGLDQGRLITRSSFEQMSTPYRPGLPYGLGIFAQEFLGRKLVWGYGQYDCYSSLFLKVPAEDLVLVLAANNNLMSDPARLIAGDVTYSLFTLSFLKNFVFNLEEIPLLESESSIDEFDENMDDRRREFYHKKLIAQSVAASFMARFGDEEGALSKKILKQVFARNPDYESYGDLILLHNLNQLKFIDSFRGNGDFSEFDAQLVGIGESLLKIDPYNPYANYYLGNYYAAKEMRDSAAHYFGQIVNAENFSSWWYTGEAQRWLDENDPKQ